MKRTVGTAAYGVRTKIIKEGDDLVNITVDSVLDTVKQHNLELKEKDVIGITESLLARAEGNYCTVNDIRDFASNMFGESLAIVFPITSRNRFSLILKGLAMTEKKINVFLNFPQDEVGNRLMSEETILKHNISTSTDILTEKEYYDLTDGGYLHDFTNLDYIELYKSFAVNNNISIYLTNNPLEILKLNDEILIANVHDRERLKDLFTKNRAKKVYTLADIMNTPINNSGYNKEYGLYGSNMATPDSLKLFPRSSDSFVLEIQENFKEKTGVAPQVLVFGDGAFKDPVGHIWELADPVVAIGYTDRLVGTPNEIKLKYYADNEFKCLSDEEKEKKLREKIKENKKEKESSLGTTPRRITDLLGSLCDLVSGSGDKGTPIVYIKGYFDSFCDE